MALYINYLQPVSKHKFTGLCKMPPAYCDDLYKNAGHSLPVKRVGEAEDVAQTYLYLIKQQFGTGQNIVVDGGTVLV